MSKFKKLFLLLVIIGFNQSAFSQYAGSFTVGGTKPDFPRLDTAFKWLAAKGVKGKVRLNVRSGVYNHRCFISKISGASLSNTITVAPDPNNTAPVIFQSNMPYTNAYLVDFNQGFINYDSIEFRALRPGSMAGRMIGFSSDCEKISFKNCKFTGIDTTGGGAFYQEYYGIFYKDDYTKVDSLNIENCTFIGGIDAINMVGTSTSFVNGLVIKNNKFYNKPNSKSPVQRYGIFLNYVNHPVVEGNYIDYNYSGYGMILFNDSFLEIKGNHIYTKSFSNSSLYLDNCFGTAAKPNLIINNSISNNHFSGSSFLHASVTINDGYYYTFCNNTIYSHNPTNILPESIHSVSINFRSGGKKYFVFKNNNIVNNCGGKAIYLAPKTLEGIEEMDYNNYYSAGPYLAYYDKDILNFSEWQKATGFDNHSINSNIKFKSLTDLGAIAAELDSAGIPVSGIDKDIDNESRDKNKPDIGANEFTYHQNDLSVIKFNSNDFPDCGLDSISAGIIIKNIGIADQTNFDVSLQIKNDSNFSWSAQKTYTKTLKSEQEDTLWFPKFRSNTGGFYKMVAFTHLSKDQYPSNDTLMFSKSIAKVAVKPKPGFDTICSNVTYNLGKAYSNSLLYRWYDSKSAGKIISKTSTLVVKNLKKDTTFYVSTYTQVGKPGIIKTAPNFEYVSCTNYKAGVYVDVIPKTDMTLDSFGTYIDRYTQAVAIYFKRGSFSGFENSPKKWVKIDSLKVKSLFNYTITNIPIKGGIKLKKDTVYSFYLNYNSPLVNTKSTTAYYTNSDLALYLGGGACSYFGKGTYYFAGQVYYSKIIDCESERVPYNVKVKLAPLVNLGRDTTYCSKLEDSLTLNAGSGYSKYLWSTSDTTPSIKISQAGKYSVKVINNTCPTYDTILVNKFIKSKINLGKDTAYCSKNGVNFNLNAGIGFTSYLWNTGAITQTLNIKSKGTYSVKVKDKNNCEGLDTLIVSENRSTEINLGKDSSYCVDFKDTFKLEAGIGYKNYLWSNFSTSPQLKVFKSGKYSVIVTDSNNCKAGDTINLILSSSPKLELGKDSTYCAHTGITITLDAGAGNASYLWSTADTISKIIVKSEGKYSVKVVGKNGCGSVDSIKFKSQMPLVNVGVDRVLNPDLPIVEILDAGAGFKSYDWSTGSKVQTTKVTNVGTYTVRVTDALGCIGSDTIEVRYWKSGSINFSGLENITIFPNPAKSILNLVSENGYVEKIKLFEMNGRLIFTSNERSNYYALNISDFADGIYLIAVEFEGKTIYKKFVVSR